jgi:2-polyprenyl-3-methyl-5-hydroxy-6-metoxy-1,4-benzoquinol methylase
MTAHLPAFSIHTQDLDKDRFAFGANWTRFLSDINADRISQAEMSLKEMLELSSLEGKTFLDIGSGSGLFSLAARRLGARVHSFDYDQQSVHCALELRKRYFANDVDWKIERGSVLDSAFVQSLGHFDIVYSWGVLHHTGSMWSAIDQAASTVAPGGKLFIAIYNDQGYLSKAWTFTKRAYNRFAILRPFILVPCFLLIKGPPFIRDLLSGHPLASWERHGKTRGMSPWRDLIDWVGGYPFEVASREQIIDFLRKRLFKLTQLKSCGGSSGCNQFVFELSQ